MRLSLASLRRCSQLLASMRSISRPAERLLDLEQIGDFALAQPRASMQASNDQPLRPRQSKVAHAPAQRRCATGAHISDRVADKVLIVRRHASLAQISNLGYYIRRCICQDDDWVADERGCRQSADAGAADFDPRHGDVEQYDLLRDRCSISSALLPQLQGALSATQDEISWVMTFNIVATAVATPATGWLADRFGQRRDHDLQRACSSPSPLSCVAPPTRSRS